jgi:sugar transferase (PEP-CTERM/EpsH1 system associated)
MPFSRIPARVIVHESARLRMTDTRRHIVHVVYSFTIGGLENVIVQLINRLPAEKFRHTVLSLTTISDFKNRITQPDVQFIELNKPPGHAIPLYPKIFKLLRKLKPDVLHTCNLAALEIVPIAWLAGVPLRIHAEHGWDAHDPNGSNPRYRKLRKFYKPFVSHYIAVSKDLDQYLEHAIGVSRNRRSLIANGVDTDFFSPAENTQPPITGCPFTPKQHWIAGTVGRLQTVKNQPFLARAFVKLLQDYPKAALRIRLVIIGDGPLKNEIEKILLLGNALQYTWLPGARNDIADIMRTLDCFVLPSQTEGTSCTLLEAMACGLPTIATAVGGTPALVEEGITGNLIPADDVASLAQALWLAYSSPDNFSKLGINARQRVISVFALSSMIKQYEQLFT